MGLISFRTVLALPRESWSETRVGEVMAPLDRAAGAGASDCPLESAVHLLSESESNRALVLADERLAGLLSITDASRVIEARRVGATPASKHGWMSAVMVEFHGRDEERSADEDP